MVVAVELSVAGELLSCSHFKTDFKEKLLARSFDESVDGLEQDGLLMGG